MRRLFLYGISMPKKNLLFSALIIFFFNALTSCQKEAGPYQSVATNVSSTDVITTSPEFGAMISDGTDDEKIQVCNELGVQYVRDAIILTEFTGKSKSTDDYLQAGFKILLNLNYAAPTGKTPPPFPTDMTKYRQLLNNVLDKYHPEIAVIENEPTTDQFHSGPIDDYITELKTAVDVCKKRGVKVADGSVNVQYVQQVMSGYGSGENYEETKKLINAYKTIDLDYVNVHTHAPFSDGDNQNVYPPGVLESVADYLRTQTGKPVICNEYNQHNTSPLLMTSAVNSFIAGNYKYVIARSDHDGKCQALNEGTTLTPLGKAYKTAIK